jgi:hypothetical protein
VRRSCVTSNAGRGCGAPANVLRTNTAMKNFARKEGFALRSPFTDARLIEIGKDLSMTAPDLPCRERFARYLPTADRDVARSLAGPA